MATRRPSQPPPAPTYRDDRAEAQTSQEKAAAQLTAPARTMAAGAPRTGHAGGKVTIACKLPLPWIDLQISRLVDKDIPGLNGTVTRKEAVQTGRFIRIRGTAYPRAGGIPDGFPGKPIMMAGFALTPNVSEDDWNEFLENGGAMMDMVRNSLVFAYESLGEVKAACVDNRDRLTGLEPLDPRSDTNGRSLDPRAPRKTLLGVNDVGEANRESDAETRLYEMLERQESQVAGKDGHAD